MSLHFGVGTGAGVRAASEVRLARPVIGAVPALRVFFIDIVPGASRLSETPGPQLHTGGSGARTTYRSKARKAVRWCCTCARFRKGPGKLNNN